MSQRLALCPACPPTAVSHSVEAHFTAGADTNLIIARATVLEVYTLRVRRDGEAPGSPPAGVSGGAGLGGCAAGKGAQALLDGVSSAYLALTATVELNGSVEGLCVIERRPRDLLMLAFADAKVSVVAFDPCSQSVVTRSAHAFESLELEVPCQFVQRPLLAMSPRSDCAAMLVYGMLIVLPLRTDGSIAVDGGAVPPLGAAMGALADGAGGAGGGTWWRESFSPLGLHHVRDLGERPDSTTHKTPSLHSHHAASRTPWPGMLILEMCQFQFFLRPFLPHTFHAFFYRHPSSDGGSLSRE